MQPYYSHSGSHSHSCYKLNVATWIWHNLRLSTDRTNNNATATARPAQHSAGTGNTLAGRAAALVSERGFHTANLIAGSNKLVVLGGVQNAASVTCSSHSGTISSPPLVQIETEGFHISESRTTGTPQSPRHSHAATIPDLGNQRASLLVSGGTNLFADLFCCDLFLLELGNTWCWHTLPAMASGSPYDYDTRRFCMRANAGGDGVGVQAERASLDEVAV
jgi:hypothetical protein